MPFGRSTSHSKSTFLCARWGHTPPTSNDSIRDTVGTKHINAPDATWQTWNMVEPQGLWSCHLLRFVSAHSGGGNPGKEARVTSMATIHHMRNNTHLGVCPSWGVPSALGNRLVFRGSSASRGTCTGRQMGPATVATSWVLQTSVP